MTQRIRQRADALPVVGVTANAGGEEKQRYFWSPVWTAVCRSCDAGCVETDAGGGAERVRKTRA